MLIYLPMVPEAFVSVLGCARIGAIHRCPDVANDAHPPSSFAQALALFKHRPLVRDWGWGKHLFDAFPFQLHFK